jgi:hypothetical protein
MSLTLGLHFERIGYKVGAAAWGERGAGDREVAGSNPASPARSCGPGCLRNPSGRWLGVASARLRNTTRLVESACGGGVKRIDSMQALRYTPL